ncbi:MAG: ABC transporter substrate-binding protein [Candidatus Binatia bacterium]
MAPLSLTLGLSVVANTHALFDGLVQPKGVELHLQSRFGEGYDNVGARHREIIAGRMDGGELSLSSFILARLRGHPLRALPVFPSRRFRHRCMFCRVDSPLQGPSELSGKKATVHRYNATTPVWLKGILQNQYGVRPEEVEWYVTEPDIGEEALRPPPTNVRVRLIPPPHKREHAVELVDQGEIDALLEPYEVLASNPKLRRLIPDFREAEVDYFHQIGALPINHTVVLREEIAQAHPWVVESLLNAFRESLSMADRYRDEREKKEAAWEREVMGEDFSYSLKKGCARRSLETLIGYQIQQEILDRKPDIESLFFPQVLDL